MGEKVMVIGSGGREHSIAWKLAQSPEVDTVFCAPGNAGTELDGERSISLEAELVNSDVSMSKKDGFRKLMDLIETEDIDMVVVGPEKYLVDGIVDSLKGYGFDRVFGPTKAAARIEEDKFFSSDLMETLNIAQADSTFCNSPTEAMNFVSSAFDDDFYKHGMVIKARGLAAGKGVSVCKSEEEAIKEIKRISKFGNKMLISERLIGDEFSVFGFSDGKKVYPLKMVFKDHKRLLDGDKGPNTGGMGAYGPAMQDYEGLSSEGLADTVADLIMTPIVQKMKSSMDVEYKGFLYAGMMMTEQGLKVLEFNARMGDPECQPAMMMLKTDLYKILDATLRGSMNSVKIELNPGAACCVVLAADGYPNDYSAKIGANIPLGIIEEYRNHPNIKVFHAGTSIHDDQVVVSGGRVLGVTGYSPIGIEDAMNWSYEAAIHIQFQVNSFNTDKRPVFHARSDIGPKEIPVIPND